MGMVAWLGIGAGIGWLLRRRNGTSSPAETVMAVAIGVVGAIVGGLAGGAVVDGQVHLEWQPGGVVGAAVGALLLVLRVRRFSR